MIILYFILAIIGGLILLGVGYELVASIRLRQRYSTPKGERVDVGGYRLHIIRSGEAEAGQPSVVLEAGIGGNSLDWQLVHDDIAKFTQVVSYDRAGYGWSDNPRQPRTPDNIVDELRKLLQNANVAPPYVLVGHSFGALYLLRFVEKFADDVAVIVFVDGAHPEMLKPINIEPELRRLRINSVIKRLGILRLLTSRALYQTDYLDEDAKAKYIALTLQDSANTFRESKPLFETQFDTSQLDKPITVISREPNDSEDEEDFWHGYQLKLAAMSDTATHIINDKRSHYIMMASPEKVIEVVRSHVMISNAQSA